jgi:putative restriction endonuclease
MSYSDVQVRLSAFSWLEEQVEVHGEVLPWRVLSKGFVYGDTRVPLLSQQGIFKPAVCELPLSIRTSPDGPYADVFSADGLLHYKYRGTDPNHHQNRGLVEAMSRRLPLVYFCGHSVARYHAVWPVYVVGADPAALVFTVAADDSASLPDAALVDRELVAEPGSELRRRYVTASVRRRLHQQAFRERVLTAYRDTCALCRLRHRELLDASHIIPDASELGEPKVANGLALCKIHHAAFDRLFLTVSPDYRIVVRPDILEEEDGPMLRHGLQSLHGQPIQLPRKRAWQPDRNALSRRYERFEQQRGSRSD